MKVICSIKGICPMLMDKYDMSDDSIKLVTSADYEKAASKKAYRDLKGNLAIGADAIKAIIKESARELTGKKRKSVEMQLNACLFVDPPMISLGTKTYDGVANHTVTRRVGKQITRVVTYRPQINEWQTKEFTIEGYGLQAHTIKEYLTFGGQMKGVYGYRPQYGRFEIVKWEVVNE